MLYLICNDVDRVGGIVENGPKLEALRGTGLRKVHHFKGTPESNPPLPAIREV